MATDYIDFTSEEAGRLGVGTSARNAHLMPGWNPLDVVQGSRPVASILAYLFEQEQKDQVGLSLSAGPLVVGQPNTGGGPCSLRIPASQARECIWRAG